jgi:hypothetical protein
LGSLEYNTRIGFLNPDYRSHISIRNPIHDLLQIQTVGSHSPPSPPCDVKPSSPVSYLLSLSLLHWTQSPHPYHQSIHHTSQPLLHLFRCTLFLCSLYGPAAAVAQVLPSCCITWSSSSFRSPLASLVVSTVCKLPSPLLCSLIASTVSAVLGRFLCSRRWQTACCCYFLTVLGS